MEHRSTMAVIVVRAGPIRSSIKALLNSVPQIGIVAEAKDISTLLHMDAEIRPDLVLLESEMSEGNLAYEINQIKEMWDGTSTIVLVNAEDERYTSQVRGADAVVVKGIRAVRFVEIIEDLLPAESFLGKG